jgi:hypothetical protein
MNRQPTTIRKYLLRGVFLLSLAFVIVMPLALGQSRNLAGKQSVAASMDMPHVAPPATGAIPSRPRSERPTLTSGPAGAHRLPILPMPQAPQVVLYDQYNNAGPDATRSTTFTDLPDFSTDLADDFVVPAGQTWNVQSIDADGTYFFGPGPATDWNVFIYTDSSSLPGTQIFSATNQPVVVVGTTFTVNLPVAAVLSAGTYWIEIQANMTFDPQGEWEWTDRMLQSNSGAAIRNPGGAVGCGTDWIRKIFCVSSMDPDQVYRLNGTMGGPIELSARKKKVGGINTVRLTWNGATSNDVDVYRNGVVVATTPNDGQYDDSTGDTGRAQYIYKVCEAGTQTCSNELPVRFPR